MNAAPELCNEAGLTTGASQTMSEIVFLHKAPTIVCKEGAGKVSKTHCGYSVRQSEINMKGINSTLWTVKEMKGIKRGEVSEMTLYRK